MKKVKHTYLEESINVVDKNLDIHYKNQTFDLSKIYYYEFNGCLFENCTFTNEGVNLQFIHCKFIHCDICNITMNKTRFYISEMYECKLIGATFNESIFDNMIINESNLKMSGFFYHKFKEVEIDKSILEESFFESSSLIKFEISNSNLVKIDVNKTKFNIDLSSNNIESIKISIEDIKGATISFDQSYDLIKLLGVKLK
ncbi:MAG: hypothetical protein R3Y64_10910 [Peptostreptococcaceae bacterium]